MRDLKNILGPDLVIFEICHFMMIPGSFKYSEKDPLRKSQFSHEGTMINHLDDLV